MAVMHRALMTWLLFTLFLIFITLKLDGQNVVWSWFTIFSPMFIFDGVVMGLIIFKCIRKVRSNYRRSLTGGSGGAAAVSLTGVGSGGSLGGGGTSILSGRASRLRDRGRDRLEAAWNLTMRSPIQKHIWAAICIALKLTFEILLCLKLEKSHQMSAFVVMSPFWMLMSALLFLMLRNLYHKDSSYGSESLR